MFIKLKYPLRLIDSVLATHLNQVRKEKVGNPSHDDVVRIVLPFRDQQSANVLRKQLGALSRKINIAIEPMFTSHKLQNAFRSKVYEEKLKHARNDIPLLAVSYSYSR